MDGNNRTKLASAASLLTLGWSRDSSLYAFAEATKSGTKLYTIGTDGRGLRQIPWSGADVGYAAWDRDGKTLYFSGYQKDPGKVVTWKASVDAAKVETLAEGCGYVEDVSADGKYLLLSNGPGSGQGVYQLSLADGKCTSLLSDLATLIVHASPDGRSFSYLVVSPGETVIYHQPWHDGKLAGAVQSVMKLPFAFRYGYVGNAYDFSSDLSTVVYARPGGQADMYLLSQK